LAARNCDHRFSCRLRALLAAAVVAIPAASTLAAPHTTAGECSMATQAVGSTDMGFSELAELTPANVRGLIPLVARTAAGALRYERLTARQQVLQPGLQVDTAASVDLRLQRFVEERVRNDLAMQDGMHRRPGGGSFSSTVGYARDSSELRAWDPVQQRVLWRVRDALPGASRTLVTAGGLVFYGTRDGWLKALDARTGRELWKHRVPGGRLEEASSYRGPGGHQYIAARALPGNPQGEREPLLVFALAH
jgi:glucose dehydrogenase